MAFLASGYPFPLTFAERVNKTIICITWNVCSLAQNVYFKTGKRLQKDNGEKKIISRVKNMYIYLKWFSSFNRLNVRKYMNGFSFYWLPYIPTAPCNNVQQLQEARIKDYNGLSNQLFIFQNFIGFVVFLTIKAPSMPISIKPI